jgi:hypothetical protein
VVLERRLSRFAEHSGAGASKPILARVGQGRAVTRIHFGRCFIMSEGKWFFFLAGYFNEGFLQLPINVFVGDQKLLIEPNGLSLVTRLGKAYLELSDGELLGTRNVLFSIFVPLPGLEVLYCKDGRKKAFTIGFPGLVWQRRRFVGWLVKSGLLSADQG